MFQFLRSRAKFFYWIIAASFILFMGLTGLSGRGCDGGQQRDFQEGVIGSVDGVKILAREYDFSVRQQTNMMRQQNPNAELNSNQFAAARQRAWDSMVRDAILRKAIADRGIEASDAEVLDTFQNNPPLELLQAYRTEDGGVDMERYYADLQNPEIDWSRYEDYVRDWYLPRVKLQEELAAQAVVTEEEVRQEYRRQTGRAVAEFVGVPFASLEEGWEADEDALMSWFEAHPDDYQRPEQARVQVVRFEKTASEADYNEVLEYITGIREEILSGQKDFMLAAQEYSEDSSAPHGGDLGTFDRNRMVAPFTEVAFSLPVGQISEPVRTKFGYHLIEVLEQHMDPDNGEVFQVHARHILIKVAPGVETIDLLRESAEDFRSRVDGGSFAATAEAEAADLLSPPPFGPGRDIPTLPLTLFGGNWAFAASPGEVSPVFENDDFFYVVALVEVLPAATAPFDEVRGQVALAVRREHQKETARAMLAPVAGEVQMGTSLATAAANAGLIYAVTDTMTYNSNVLEVGYGTEFNAAAIEGTVGELVPAVETLRGVYALIPQWIKPFDEADFELRREGIRQALLGQARALIVEEWIEAQVAAADVQDHRLSFGMGI